MCLAIDRAACPSVIPTSGAGTRELRGTREREREGEGGRESKR